MVSVKMMIIIVTQFFAINGMKYMILNRDVELLLPEPLKVGKGLGLQGFNAFSFKCANSARDKIEGFFYVCACVVYKEGNLTVLVLKGHRL